MNTFSEIKINKNFAGTIRLLDSPGVAYFPHHMTVTVLKSRTKCPECKQYFGSRHPNNGCTFADVYDVCEA